MFEFQRRIVVDILTIFVSLLLVTAVAIILYSYTLSTKAVIRVATDLLSNSHATIIKKLEGYLSPEPIVRISSFLMSDRILDFSDMKELTNFSRLILQSYPQLNNIYIADEQGNIFSENDISKNLIDRGLIAFVNPTNMPAETKYITEYITHDVNGESLLTIDYKSNEGTVLATEKKLKVDYDPRSRPWYQGAKNSLSHHWIGVYEFFGARIPGITIAYAIRKEDTHLGVIAVDIPLDLLVKELASSTISKESLNFIVNNHNQVIAYENNTHSNSKEVLPQISELNNPIITKGYSIFRTNAQNHFIFQVGSKKYIAQFTPFSLNSTDQWYVASIVPLDFFVGSLKRTNTNNLIFSLAMLGIGLLFVIVFSRKISRPIMDLAAETRELVKLQDSGPVQIKSNIYEIQVMANAVNVAKSVLSSFAKYVPKALVLQLLENKTSAELGGQKKNLSILFTDIANFTEISEQTDPELIMVHLSEYFNELTKIIQHSKGNIDKYIGDSIMAFWNAPLNNPNYVHDACKATLLCREEVHKMNNKWYAQGKPLFPTRFGLNTGSVVVGNVGSSDRLNYTALGDVVNLASRLQSVNKIYQTEIIASEAVYQQCVYDFLWRPLDKIQVKGKQEFTIIYELMANKQASEDQIQLCILSTEAYKYFWENQIQEAYTIFKDIIKKFPEDGMAKIYIKRCEEYLMKGSY